MRTPAPLTFGTLIFGILLLLSSSAVSAQEPLHTVDEYIRYAMKNSVGLEAAFEDYRAATKRPEQVATLPNPNFQYGHFIESVETRVGPQKHTVGVAQSFPWFGTLQLRGEEANLEASAEFNRFLAKKNKLVFEINEAYSELAYAQAAEKVTSDSLQLVQSWEQVLQQRFRTGSGSHSDLIKVQVELGRLEVALAAARDAQTPLRVRLNSLLSREHSLPTPIATNFLQHSNAADAKDAEDDTRDFFELIQSHNPELRMLHTLAEARRVGLALAEKKYYPDITLGINYVAVGDRDVPGGGDDALLGTVSLSLPVFLSKNRAAVAEASARSRGLKQRIKEKEYSLRAELSRIRFNLRDSRRKISLYKDTLIPKTNESIEASYTAYQSGEANFLDVIDSEERLLEYRLALKRAQADLVLALSKLQMLAGGYSGAQTEEKE